MNLKRLRRSLGKLAVHCSGDFYIFQCSDDVLSGYALDVPPSSFYLSSFVLPAYDKHDFLHLSLGERIISASREGATEDDVIAAIENDWRKFSKIRDPSSLLGWMEIEHHREPYERWATLLTLCRLGRLNDAAELINELTEDWLPFSNAVEHRYVQIKRLVETQDGRGIGLLLDEWSSLTQSTYCVGS
jgi:hypothetical protein